jgi:glycosyltransferase involved in cell wall biosynthesis
MTTPPSTPSLTVLSRPVGGRDATEAARGSFEELGCETVLTDDASFDPSEANAVLVWGNAGLFPRAFERLAALQPSRRPVVAVWHSEVLPFARASGVRRPRLTTRELAKAVLRHPRAIDPYTNARRLVRLVRRGLLDLVVVISEDRREYLAERGVESEVVPRGYHPSFGSDLGGERDVDVLFLGALDVPRRRRVLRRLERAGIDVLARGDWRDPQYWGAPRAALLNRAKISLNLSRHAGQFSGDRFTLSMGNGALVVSEPAHRPAPFRPGEHYVEARTSDLAVTISRLLADDEELRRIAAAGREFVTRELTMTNAAAKVLALIERRVR